MGSSPFSGCTPRPETSRCYIFIPAASYLTGNCCSVCSVFTLKIQFKSNHPSIFCTCLIRRSGRGGAGAYPSCHWVTLDRSLVHHRATQRQTTTDTLTPKDNLESPVNLTCMLLDSGRKPENPERTHAYTGRTCRLHTERPQVGVEPGTLSL